MRLALLLVDMQEDFLARPGLAPPRAALIGSAAALLAAARAAGVPIVHVHTVVAADGHDAMPHWRRQGTSACMRGTPGALPPPALRPLTGETVIEKRFFSGFGAPALEAALREVGADTLLVAGLYLHGCVRATAFDAYERGFAVLVADDAVGSDDPAHAEMSREYLDGRAATFVDGTALLARLAVAGPADHGHGLGSATARPVYTHRNPARLDEVLHEVSIADAVDVDRGVRGAREAFLAATTWSIAERAACLERWASAIESRADAFARAMATEIGKPITEARDELGRALAHVRTAARLFSSDVQALSDDVAIRYRPHGVVAIVTPFNNPLAIPAGKLAPALLFGNAVAWKPALEAVATTELLRASLRDAGVPADLVTVVQGDAGTARALVRHPGVHAVTLTGSNATGRAAHALCARLAKPLQAELGGNNAAVVLLDCDLEAEARWLARAAYGFAGQRCTAIRRLVVERPVLAAFTEAFRAAVAELAVGDPHEPVTVVGPLVSETRRARVLAAVAEATAGGARRVDGGKVGTDDEQPSASGRPRGAWLAPVLLDRVAPTDRIFVEESFGPVALLVPADGFEQALALANAVPHGLVAHVATRDGAARRRFAAAVEAGIVRVDRRAPFLHADAPFGGWRASGIGPPEHGAFDRAFYARPQALYGRLEDA